MTSRSPAASFACRTHDSMPSVTKCTRSYGLSAGGWWVGTKIGSPPGDDGTAGHRLVEDKATVGIGRPVIVGIVAVLTALTEPVHQSHAADAGRIVGVVARACDEPVERHR